MKVAVIFTAIEGVGTPHLAVFRAHNPTVPYFVATKPADLHFNRHMDDTIVECWAKNRNGLEVDYVIHADYDTRIACDVTRALALHEDKLVDVLANTWTLGGRGMTFNLIAFRPSMLNLMVERYAEFEPGEYCERRIMKFCQAHKHLHGHLMPPDVCRELLFDRRDVFWWEQRFAHPVKRAIDDLHDENAVLEYAKRLKPYATESFHGWFDYRDLYDYIVEQAPDGAKIVELGVWCGKSLGYLGERAIQAGKNLRIIGYDHFSANGLRKHRDSPLTGLTASVRSDDDWASAIRLRMRDVAPENPPMVMCSSTASAAGLHDDRSVWAVFVDADHSAAGVRADVCAWLPKLETGGLLAGHDFSQASVRQGLTQAGLSVRPVSRDSWMTRTWPEQSSKSNTTADNILHVLIACTRPDGVSTILNAVKSFPQVMLHIGTDLERKYKGGHILKDKLLDSIADGWVWICDDDNLPHEEFLRAILDKITNAPPNVRGFIVSQSRSSGLSAAQPPRVNTTDIAQLIARISAIGDLRLPEHAGGDGHFVRAVWDGGDIQLLPEVVVSYNASAQRNTTWLTLPLFYEILSAYANRSARCDLNPHPVPPRRLDRCVATLVLQGRTASRAVRIRVPEVVAGGPDARRHPDDEHGGFRDVPGGRVQRTGVRARRPGMPGLPVCAHRRGWHSVRRRRFLLSYFPGSADLGHSCLDRAPPVPPRLTPMPAPRKLRIFRMKGDQRIPYTIELDATLTVIAEYADMTAVDHVAEGRATQPQETSPERRKAITMARWATDKVDVNPIPGSEELRVEFFEARKALEASYENSPCPPCQIGKLIRAYRDKLVAKGLL